MAEWRKLKSTIRTSKTVNSLTDFQFRLWVYLITYVDDHGRGSADPELLNGIVFPRRKGVTESQIKDALTVLANKGMITLYEVDGESYFYFPKWGEHQRIQAKYSDFPDPPQSTVSHGESPWVTVNHRLDKDIDIEKDKDIDQDLERYIGAELPSTTALTIQLNNGLEYPISQDYVNQMQELYPAVDVIQELRNMKAWCISNPKKRKTASGIRRFINSWLAEEQNRGGHKGSRRGGNDRSADNNPNGATDNIFLQIYDEEHGNDQG